MSITRARSSHEVDVAALLAQARAARTRNLLQRSMAAGAVALVGVQGLAACGTEDVTEPEPEGSAAGPNVPAPGMDPGKTDWAQFEGQRNTEAVQYRGDYWTEHSNCNTRGGCMALDTILKVFVRPTAGANVDDKRVGVVFRHPDWDGAKTETALGSYFSTSQDGWEEWHVRIRAAQWSTSNATVVFNAWYQDGAAHTYYDDNQGEFHVAAGFGSPIGHYPSEYNPESSTVKVDDQGVHGKLGVYVADLDYDKELELVWTTDGWQTSSTAGIGDGQNKWKWEADRWSGTDLFTMDVNLPGQVTAFEYAIVYRHGVVNNAKVYEFWANGGGSNYVVTR